MSELVQEIGCGHDFGVVHDCIFCGRPRHLSTSKFVTRRFIEEHPNELTPYSWPPPHEQRLGLVARILSWWSEKP
jgi:hypothetical protein